jgi:hypothetical protein
MAFPSTAGTAPEALSVAWVSAMSVAGAIKTDTQAVRAQSLAGNVGASRILNHLTFLADQKVRLQAIAALPGIGAYAQAQANDPGLNVAAEFTAMLAAMDGVRDWVIANFPASGGFLQAQSIQADGRTTDRQFSTAQLANYRTQLDALIAAIN